MKAFEDDLASFLHLAVGNYETREHARASFRHAQVKC